MNSHQVKLKNMVTPGVRDIVFSDFKASSQFLRWMLLYADKADEEIQALQKKASTERNNTKKQKLLSEIQRLSKPMRFGDYELQFGGTPITVAAVKAHTITQKLYF